MSLDKLKQHLIYVDLYSYLLLLCPYKNMLGASSQFGLRLGAFGGSEGRLESQMKALTLVNKDKGL